MTRRGVAIGLGLLAAVLLLAVGAVGIVLRGHVELAPAVSRYATARLGRDMTIASLHASLGTSLTIDVSGLRLANAPGGSRPDMATLDQAEIALDPWALLRGRLFIRRLRIAGLSVLLEHAAGDIANWKFGAAALAPSAPEPGGPRRTLPTMLDAVLEDADIAVRSSSGEMLHVILRNAALRTDGDDQPVMLSGDGAYNALPLTLRATTQSFAVLRDTGVPFGADLHMESGRSTLAFAGTMMDPLDVDGVNGHVDLDASELGSLLLGLGLQLRTAMPFSVKATLAKQGDDWRFDPLAGGLSGQTFSGRLELREGARRQPDAITTELRFPRIDLKPLLAGLGASGGPTTMPSAEAKPGTLLNARLAAGAVRYGGIDVADFTAHLVIDPGRITLDDVGFGIAGAKAVVRADATPASRGTRVTAEAGLSGLDAAELARMLSSGPPALSGRVELHASADATGATMEAALRDSHVAGVLAMQGGAISRDLMQAVSVDISRIFGSRQGVTTVSCLLGAVDLHGLAGPLSPLRIVTADGTITGNGRIDLGRGMIDLFLRTERASTAFTALDVPLHVSGRLAHPDISPAVGQAARADANTDGLAALPPALQRLARANPCLRGVR